jgi:signal recognition particle subunit SRP72
VLDLDPTDRISAAGLVASCVGAEPPVPTDSLMPLETLIAEVDISSLESAGAAQAVPKRGAEDEAGPRSRTKKARKRKPRMPKEYDASKQPDPERWLPLRDRSYYKPKGKPERKKAAASTQGGAVEESMELAGGDRVDVVKVDQAKKAAGNKQKKKKGGKR